MAITTWLAAAFLPAAGLPALVDAVDRVGLDGISFPDHTMVPARIESQYPYSADRRAEIPLHCEFADPLCAIAALASRSPRLRFAAQVLNVPIRQPVLLAKQTATVAAMTSGQLELAVGVGWMREEYEAYGLLFDEREARLDESIHVLRQLWTGDLVDHHGEHFQLDSLAVHPVPTAPIPIIVVGETDDDLDRAARYGDGWSAITPSAEQARVLIERLQEARRAHGTADRPFEIRSGIKGRITVERVRALVELGVTSLLIAPWQIATSATSLYDIEVDDVISGLPAVVETIAVATKS